MRRPGLPQNIQRAARGIITYERPHIVHMLEVLFNGMAETAVGVEKMNGGGAHGSKAILDYVYKRPQWRMEAMRLSALQFLGPGLSERHKELDRARVDLGKASFPQDADGVKEVVRRLGSIMGIVVQAIKGMRHAEAIAQAPFCASKLNVVSPPMEGPKVPSEPGVRSCQKGGGRAHHTALGAPLACLRPAMLHAPRHEPARHACGQPSRSPLAQGQTWP